MKNQNHDKPETKTPNPPNIVEEELSEGELDEVSGGITPIPIPGVDLSKYLQQPILPVRLPDIKPTGFEGGGGIG